MRELEAGLQLREYRLEHRIGRGGEGDVWMALDLEGKAVALKARPHTDDQDAQRFRSEFTRLRTLQLPNVVRVLDVGADQGYLFFTMEVAHGVPFHAFSDASHSKKEQITRVCAAGAQVARALASIHRLGLAHRDIKPANIHVREDLVSREVHAIVLDFGTHHFGGTQDADTPLFGTVPYMAPEQRLGMPHDHRVDLYSLGTVLHEALTGTKAQDYSPGQRRASLVGLGPHIPLHLADLIDRLLDLDPSDRPSAEEAEAVLHGIALNLRNPPCTWPKPVVATPKANPLLQGNRMVVGGLGDGVGRHIANARWHWYRKGYLSVMGRCDPSRPYAPFQAILAQLFHQRGTADRVVLAGAELAVLHGIWPEIPLPCEQPMIHAPNPEQAADALAAVFNRCSPIALIVHHVHKADPGTAKVLPLLMSKLAPENRLWSSSIKEHADIEWIRPPKWNQEMHEAAWRELLGPDSPIPPTTPDGYDFLKLAWAEIGHRQGHTAIPQPMPESLCRLSILRSPFPQSVAVQMAPDLDLWIDAGYLEVVAPATAEASARLRFASEATRTLAEADLTMTLEANTLAAIAWGRFPEDDEAVRSRTLHLLLAGTVQPSDLTSAIQLEVTRERPGQVRRWMDLLRLHVGQATMQASDRAFEYHYAQCYTQLHIAPATITLDDVRELAAEADTVPRRGLAAHFKLAHAIRTGDSEWVISEGRRWASSLSSSHPVLAARMLREIALADLGTNKNQHAIRDSREALSLARRGASSSDIVEDTTAVEQTLPVHPRRLTQPEIDAATTYSAALVYAGRSKDAEELCAVMGNRCMQAGYNRGAAAFLINRGIALHRLGNRSDATDALAEAQTLQHTHGDPVVFANQVVASARLAVERADPAAAQILLDEAITASTGVDDPDLLSEAWSCVLDLATQTGNKSEARRALTNYGTNNVWSLRDHWPAALARWSLSTGDLDGALSATEAARTGFGWGCTQAERARLLLMKGNNQEASSCATSLLNEHTVKDFYDIQLFGQLVLGAANAVPDAEFTPLIAQSRNNRWAHLYLGALHLDAIRRGHRGENVTPVLRRLKARATDLRHKLYLSLANPQRW